jgi:hypothetical protein
MALLVLPAIGVGIVALALWRTSSAVYGVWVSLDSLDAKLSRYDSYLLPLLHMHYREAKIRLRTDGEYGPFEPSGVTGLIEELYQDVTTLKYAMRNFNGHEFPPRCRARPARVVLDGATGSANPR